LDADGAAFGAKAGSVVHRSASLILPLVHHLMQQCVDRFGPAIASNVAVRNHDLATAPIVRAQHVVTEPTREATGYLYLEVREQTAEMREIELRVQRREPRRHRGVIGVPGGRAACSRANRHRIRHDHGACRRALAPVARRREDRDRRVNVWRRLHESLVDTEDTAGEAPHRPAISCQDHALDPTQAPGTQLVQKVIGIEAFGARWRA